MSREIWNDAVYKLFSTVRSLIADKSWSYRFSCITIAMSVAFISVVLAVRFRLIVATHKVPYPQAILVLGGDGRRELAAAKLAAQQPTLEIWVSSGLLPTQATEIFLAEEVSLSRVNLDYGATDTVTNFTTLVTTLQARDVQHIYLITSDFHMRRSKAIAFWILGSRGIAHTPVSVPSIKTVEPYYKMWRDIARSWLWLLTGHTGSSINPGPPVKSS